MYFQIISIELNNNNFKSRYRFSDLDTLYHQFLLFSK